MSDPALPDGAAPEAVWEQPVRGPDGAPARPVRCFLRTPPARIGAATPLLVVLHGLGGRQNDISYKRFRKEAAERLGCLVLGVNFSGTGLHVNDPGFAEGIEPHVHQALGQITRAIAAERAAGRHPPLPFSERTQGWWLTPPAFWIARNAEVVRQLALPVPDAPWDWGGQQALDVLTALGNVLDRLRATGVDVRRLPIHLIAQSAGSQVAYQCLRLAPRTWSSVLDIGGLCCTAGLADVFRTLLTEEFGDADGGHFSTRNRTYPGGVVVTLQCRTPVAFPQGRVPPPRTLDDELCLRRLDGPGAWADGIAADTRVLAFGGADDGRMPIAERQRLDLLLRQAGADAELRTITAAAVDGTIFNGTGHEICASFAPVFWAHGAPLLAAGPRNADIDPGSGRSYRLPTSNGAWTCTHGPVPTLDFLPGAS